MASILAAKSARIVPAAALESVRAIDAEERLVARAADDWPLPHRRAAWTLHPFGHWESPADDERGVRIEFFGDEVDRIVRVDPVTGEVSRPIEQSAVFPASHYVSSREALERAITSIEGELEDQLARLEKQNKLLEHARKEGWWDVWGVLVRKGDNDRYNKEVLALIEDLRKHTPMERLIAIELDEHGDLIAA